MASLLRGSIALLGPLLGLGVLGPDPHAQTVWRVRESARPGGDGATWATALDSLQKALDVATPADEIWVAAGSYRPVRLADPADPRSARFPLRQVRVFGGFDGSESSRAEREPELFDDTVLSGDLAVRLRKSLLRLRALRRGVVTLVAPCSAARKAACAVAPARS